MPDEVPQSNDFWNELEEAEESVEKWPPWQQRYEADVYYDRDGVLEGRGQSAEGRAQKPGVVTAARWPPPQSP